MSFTIVLQKSLTLWTLSVVSCDENHSMWCRQLLLVNESKTQMHPVHYTGKELVAHIVQADIQSISWYISHIVPHGSMVPWNVRVVTRILCSHICPSCPRIGSVKQNQWAESLIPRLSNLDTGWRWMHLNATRLLLTDCKTEGWCIVYPVY